MTTTYTPKQIAGACGITPVCLRSYHGYGLKSEGPVTGDAEGKRRHYTFCDGVAAAVMNRIVQRGISRRHAADIVNDWRKYFAGRFWLAVFPGPDAEEAPGRQGGNTAPDIAKLVAKARPDGSMPAEVIILAVHEIAADVRNRLDQESAG
jgi:hypothetical protein